jgi:pimeloyl-ACP methyl ester carboxylesterase
MKYLKLFPERDLKSIAFAVIRIAMLIYLGLGTILYLRQDSYLFFPPDTPFEECTELSSAEYVNAEGTRAYLIASGSPQKIAIVYHGNAERACDSAYLAPLLVARGYNVLLPEYTGYAGDASGEPSVEALLQDVRHIDEWVTARSPWEEVLIIGRSIGTGFASYHASIAEKSRLILISPFDGLGNLAGEIYPVYPVSLLLKTDLDNVRFASAAEAVLIVHGEIDTIIPAERGRALFFRLPQEDKRYVEIPGVGHNDVLGKEDAWRAIEEFLKK